MIASQRVRMVSSASTQSAQSAQKRGADGASCSCSHSLGIAGRASLNVEEPTLPWCCCSPASYAPFTCRRKGTCSSASARRERSASRHRSEAAHTSRQKRMKRTVHSSPIAALLSSSLARSTCTPCATSARSSPFSGSSPRRAGLCSSFCRLRRTSRRKTAKGPSFSRQSHSRPPAATSLRTCTSPKPSALALSSRADSSTCRRPDGAAGSRITAACSACFAALVPFPTWCSTKPPVPAVNSVPRWYDEPAASVVFFTASIDHDAASFRFFDVTSFTFFVVSRTAATPCLTPCCTVSTPCRTPCCTVSTPCRTPCCTDPTPSITPCCTETAGPHGFHKVFA
mmetsp:Transcript_8775/g.19459  ORF Transcript_8775/g.19459 Transcript_8775/m.19459 type:complete len:341 (+) Transcript_8775:526-1548(+)